MSQARQVIVLADSSKAGKISFARAGNWNNIHVLITDKSVDKDFAKELGITNWAQYFLKWVISHPAITCAIPATSNPVHQSENISVLKGTLPDQEMRKRMLRHMESIPGFDKLHETPPYPGKAYNGIIRRAQSQRTAAPK